MQRRRKLEQEVEEIRLRETDTRLDYQGEKDQIAADVDKQELTHLHDIRLIKDKIAESAIETRRAKDLSEKERFNLDQDQQAHQAKMVDLNMEKKTVQQSHDAFKQESEAQERDLRIKLSEVMLAMKEVIKEEHAFNKRKQAFDDEHQKIVVQNDQLQEELDKYCIEKDNFDREAQKVKEKGEQDQIESEKIGFFKANKDRLRDELRKLKQDIESERQQLREDKIKLEIFKNELSTKQKTIETLRYNYIKSDQQSLMDRAEAISQAKSTVIPIKPPVHEHVQMTLPRMPESTAPRFKYEDYMKSLSDKIQGNAPNASAYIGADF